MWPILLNMTRDECRRTLRSLELEAYSNMMNVFRAQGPLEDNRKRLLEDLRAVLHISHDRHSAEARRVSNDELLATIAQQLSGPNTGLAWICEGRRRVPLLPRGIAQTMYTEIADKAAEAAAAENEEFKKKLEADKLLPPKTEQNLPGGAACDLEQELCVPVAMEDQTVKLWETELITRKRKIPEGGALPGEATTVKSVRNIQPNTNQKHPNLSHIYSNKYSQPSSSKSMSQSKHSYNQVSKVSTSKSDRAHAPKHRKRQPKQPAPIVLSKSQMKKPHEITLSPSKYPGGSQMEYTIPPNTFQASYAQAVLGSKCKPDYLDEMKPKAVASGMVTDSPTMQLMTQPATVPHELNVADNAHVDPSTLQAQTPSNKHTITGKPCHLIIKNRGDITSTEKKHPPEVKVIQKTTEGLKLITNKQVVVAPSATQKALNSSGKFVATKVISSMPKLPKSRGTSISSERMIVVSKGSAEKVPNSKIIITSSVNTPIKTLKPISTNSISTKTTEILTPKGIPATDLKVSAKTVVLNPKSGQKMVMMPARCRTASGGEMPIVHVRGIPANMKLVPVSSHPATSLKSSTMTVVSKPTVVNTITQKKILGVEPIKTANMADIVPVKGLTPTTKITNPIVRPSNTKGNVIVVSKGSLAGKKLTFTKNGKDMSKIIMGKNVNQLLQKSDQGEAAKHSGNVIVLELNNEQTGRTTTMSEILDSSRGSSNTSHVQDDKNVSQEITQDTPVVFDNEMMEESCNTSSLDSTTESIDMQMDSMKSQKDDSETAKDTSSMTDWEMELEAKEKDDDKLNSMHLDLGMSSDSDNEYMVGSHKAQGKQTQENLQATPSGESSVYSSSSGMSVATRTLLSQLQDDGSSSNDSSFALKSKSDKHKEIDAKLPIDKSECDALTKAKQKLSEKVAKSQLQRIDIYSTAITTSEINLDSFSYLEESMMAGDDEDVEDGKRTERERRGGSIDDQLSRLLGEDSAQSNDSQSQTVSDSLPLSK